MHEKAWDLCRVWTVDWWDNRDREINKLLTKLDKLKAAEEKLIEKNKAEEEALKKEAEAREAENRRIMAELEAQAAQVIAEDEEADREKEAVEIKASAEREILLDTAEKNDGAENLDVKPETEEQTVDDKQEVEREQLIAELPDVGKAEKPSTALGEPVEYIFANLDVPSLSSSEFAAASNKKEIADRIIEVVNTEAPILKTTLMRRIFTAYGVTKSNAVVDAFEKALKASKVKITKQKSLVYCWNDSQDPKNYYDIRVSSDRSGDEICQQEIRNAVCYVLKKKGILGRDDLVKETSLVFGYKRLGKNLESVLLEGVKWAKSSGAIISAGPNKFAIAPDDSE